MGNRDEGRAAGERAGPRRGFRHEALLYRGDVEFAAGVVPFVQAGVDDGEPVVVALSRYRASLVRFGLDAVDGVHFIDMEDVGRNPARLIPALQDFLDAYAGRPVRGVGEPIWRDRTAAELVEAQHHERLINTAFADTDLWGLCPYDVATLDAGTVAEASRSHPVLVDGTARLASPAGDSPPTALDGALEPPGGRPDRVAFAAGELADVRRFVARRAGMLGMASGRTELLVMALNELVTNSVVHGGGSGELLLWEDEGAVAAEVRDRGHIEDPLTGRIRPDQQQTGGRGLWLVNQVCDLVQVRSRPGATVVRVRMAA